MPEVEPEFYVGYAAAAPPRLARTLRWVAGGFLAGGLAMAWLLVRSQSPFDESRFEFLQYKPYGGTLFEWPYPLLVSGDKWYLLAGEGKHGVAGLVSGKHGANVTLAGALIESGENRMLELLPGSLKAGEGQGRAMNEPVSLGRATLAGEIVDTKCYFGVMNPGRGKVHRDCAARCLSGGIPPGFRVRDSTGRYRVLLLVRPDGRAFGRELLPYAGEPVTISGETMRTGPLWYLKADPAAIQRE